MVAREHQASLTPMQLFICRATESEQLIAGGRVRASAGRIDHLVACRRDSGALTRFCTAFTRGIGDDDGRQQVFNDC